MAERVFRMRMFCEYGEPDNAVEQLQAEILKEDEWQDFELDAGTPGFLIFVYSVFTCQQMHLRMGCRDHDLKLASAAGEIELVVTDGWMITKLDVDFAAALREGEPAAEAVEAIMERMKNCPVSRNLTCTPQAETRLRFRLG